MPHRLLPSAVSLDDPKLAAALGAAIRHLDATAREQEYAVVRILGLVELLLGTAQDTGTRARLEGILEACGFQDICGQRLSKVRRLLHYLQDNGSVGLPPGSPRPSEDDPLPPGLSQEQVDRLLRGERL